MVKNKLEIRICGLQRSGNHAITNWIINQYRGSRICFLNNVRHGDYNPFHTREQVYLYNFKGFPNGMAFPNRGVRIPDELIKSSKDVLIYSYEDDRRKLVDGMPFLRGVYSKEFEARRGEYLGESERFLDVVVVRDPYNLLASRIKRIDKLTGINDVQLIIEFIKEILYEAIMFEEEKDPKSKKLIIKYNQWFSDKNYRRFLSEKIGGKFNDSSLHEVLSVGGGSSFDGVNFGKLKIQDLWYKRRKLLQVETYQNIGSYLSRFFPRRTEEMQVLERWKVIEDSQMEAIFSDPEVAELSKRLFGDILKP